MDGKSALIEGVHGKGPYVTFDRLQDSPSKFLSTSLYRKGEFDLGYRLT